MEARATPYIPYEQYLVDEEAALERHEWLNGEVFVMAGGTEEHAVLGSAVQGELGIALRGRPCRVASGDLRVRSMVTGLSTYADATVVCGKREPHPEDTIACINPTVLIEVLSPSTEAYDRGEKFEHSRTFESLRDYVLVSTGRNHIDHYARNADGSWTLRACGPGQALTLTGCDVGLEVDAIYLGVEALREEPVDSQGTG